MLVRCRPVRPILRVPRGRSLQICSGHAPERPNKVSGVSVGVDLVENDSVDREGALHRLRRRHGAMSHLRAPRCSSHCLCMIIMELRGRRAVPLEPHADLGRARACRCRFVGLLGPVSHFFFCSLAPEVGWGVRGVRGVQDVRRGVRL